MGEEAARFQHFEYRSNQNYVLQTLHRRHRANTEGAGDPTSLSGRITHRMGDMHREVITEERKKELEKLERKKRRAANGAERSAPAKRMKLAGPSSVLSNDILEGIRYQPKKRETRHAYQELIAAVQKHIGAYQPQNVTLSATDEVLALLKDENILPVPRQKEIKLILGDIDGDAYNHLIKIAKQITDYSADSNGAADADDNGAADEDEDAGVAVLVGDEIDDEDDDDDDEMDDESDDEVGEDTGPIFKPSVDKDGNMYVGDIDDDSDVIRSAADSNAMQVDSKSGDQKDIVDPRDIDAYWLQRQITTHTNVDHETSAQLANTILPILGIPDFRQTESELLELLDVEQFEFVKFLTKNKLAIYYCTLLGQAASDDERHSIESQMSQEKASSALLSQLRSASTGSRYASLKSDKLNARDSKASTGSNGDSAQGAAPYAFDHRANTIVDLESLKFQGGSHLMTNKKIQLPNGTKTFVTKEYEEVLIPATIRTAGADEERFPISGMPAWAQRAFQGVESLNPVQSKLRATALETSENFLLCAPTGAGKTNVAMLAMLHEIGLHYDAKTDSVDLDAFKIVYVAPMKSLVQEMVHNFGQRLQPFGVSVRELSGDSSLTKSQVAQTQVIITTPEKWDIITRKSGRDFTDLVKLVIIDEIHLLHDERGPVLESIVARTVRQIESTQKLVRLVGLSATLPNYEDVATFLRVKPEHLYAFKNSHRPIPLEQAYIGVTTKKPFKRLQVMNEVCYEKLISMAGEQILVFVHSRKETAKTAFSLRDMAVERGTLSTLVSPDATTREILEDCAKEVKNADLKELLPYGFGIHHAGMTLSDRRLVEDLYENRKIQVLVSTATLAWGVNLPAHAVIIKGTQIYNSEKGGWMELSSMDVMQMLGRAGRPQYDTKGVGIVITSHDELQFYLSLLNHQLPIESQFINKLADNLNAEVVLGSVQSVKDAVEWLGYTYLYVCMLRNPGLYGVSAEQLERDPYLEQRRADLVHTVATELAKSGVLRYDRKSGLLQSTDLGRIASHYYIPHQSIAIYNEHLKATTGEIELLRVFSLSKEFSQLAVRQDEKLELEKLLERVPVPVKESMDESAAKINVLLQAFISQLKLEGFSLMSDMVYVTQSAGRIMRCLFEITLKKGWASVAERCLNYCKMIEHRIWLSQSPLRQFKDLPIEAIRKIETKELTLDRLYALNSSDIGNLIRYPELGKRLHAAIHQCPKLDLSPTIQPLTRSLLQVELTITPDFQFVESIHSKTQHFWIMVTDVDGEQILHAEMFTLKAKYAEQEHYVSFTVPLSEVTPPQYFIKCVSDRFLTFETVKPISFRHLIPPDRFPEPKPLHDLPPLDLQSLDAAEFRMALLPVLRSDLLVVPRQITAEVIPSLTGPIAPAIPASVLKGFDWSSAKFNHVQTQCFNAFYGQDNSVLLFAPSGSGKSTCAELAIMHQLAKETPGNIAYVCGTVERVPVLLRSMQTRYPERTISALTGEAAIDVKLLEASDLVLATPQQWDALSRRWKQRAAVQKVSLFVVESLQSIGSGTASGVALEVVLSRMRYMARQLKANSQNEYHLRFIGLGNSIANSNNFADWLGVTNANCFNFHPQVRPIPVEISLQSFEAPAQSQANLNQAMIRPLLSALSRSLDGSAPAILFTPSRKFSRSVTLDLMTFLQAENTPQRFLHASEDELQAILAPVDNGLLRNALIQGIGFVNESLLEREIALVCNLFEMGKIQILIATRSFAYKLSVRSKFVAIVGTQYYEGKEHRYVDYGIQEMLQMISFAGRQAILGAAYSSGANSINTVIADDSCKCLIMCHQKKREFYKKFIAEPVPIESHLELFLHDHLNAEIYTKVIENTQETLDYLTWTFYYRRLSQNPNYYGLQGVSHTHLSDKLSELMEETLKDLEQAKAIAIEDETEVSVLNAGMISAFYYIRYTTIELFNSSLTAKTKMRGLIEILANASEFEDLPIRHKENQILQKLAAHLPVKIERPDYYSPATKVNILLQCHFSRKELPIDLEEDQKLVLAKIPELLQAMVDIISSNGWLQPAVAAMELSQMVVQAVWDSESVFRQLPHFTPDVIARLTKLEPECESVFDLLSLEDKRRNEILKDMTKKQMGDIARVCNQFPNIEVEHGFKEEEVPAGETATLVVKLERDMDGNAVPPVHAPFFPKKKIENWWLVVGDQDNNTMLVVKRIPLANATQNVKLEFTVPTERVGKLALSLISDSWIGCDQEYELELNILPPGEAIEDEDSRMQED